ncbi:MAG: nitrate- and nitrite sensing domain-containing protein [Micromonosporaceae bacterium]|nr:nitrate- and nitrite sensing domain-containing protein [Micromonosporaceae bacterium]
MLGRLRIRQKLAVLLAIPLSVVALVMAALTVDRVSGARTYAATAETALAAREVGGLIQTLQQERLLALAYLVIPSFDRSAYLRESQTAIDEATRLAAQPRTAAIMERAGRWSLRGLDELRHRVAERTASPIVAYYAYRSAIVGLIQALDLARLEAADAKGLREVLALDALIHANEEASSTGAILVGSIGGAGFTNVLLRSAVESEVLHLTRFRELADRSEASLVDKVLRSEAAERLRSHIDMALAGGPRPSADVSDVLSAALSYTGLRRLAQDRVARDVAQAARRDATAATTAAVVVAVGATLLFLGVAALAVMIGRSIAAPLRRLTRAVGAVAELSRAELVRVADSEELDRAPPELASVEVDSDDEIAELADAVNRVQSTAASLLERQATARANVATMFANVSRRTQNLVDRQLHLIDDLARQESDPQARERLLHLQSVTTRLRRTADSLLVVSGTIDQQINAMPARLAAVIDSARREVDGAQRIEIADGLPDLAVAAEIVSDLRLLIAELLENAVSFTPPGSRIEVRVSYDRQRSYAADCTVMIIDHGLGMSPARMEEENRRLIERERLDVAPTRVLGLFVVGRLARRHGLTVRLEPTPGRGVTAVVRIPARWLAPASAPSGPAGLGVVPPLAVAAIESAARSGPFPWLTARSGPRTPDAASATTAPTVPTPTVPAPALAAPVPPDAPTVPVAPGAPTAPVPPGAPARPVPSSRPAAAGVAAAGRAGPSTRAAARPVRTRDPEAERAALDAYAAGLARAAAASEPGPSDRTTGAAAGDPPAPILDETSPHTVPASTLVERHS